LAEIENNSSLTPLGQMNRNLAESIYGRSSIKIAHFIAATGNSSLWLADF
jgi:hypothetical protein